LLLDLDNVGEVAVFADLGERPGGSAARRRCIHPTHVASTPESSSHCALAQASASRSNAAASAPKSSTSQAGG